METLQQVTRKELLKVYFRRVYRKDEVALSRIFQKITRRVGGQWGGGDFVFSKTIKLYNPMRKKSALRKLLKSLLWQAKCVCNMLFHREVW